MKLKLHSHASKTRELVEPTAPSCYQHHSNYQGPRGGLPRTVVQPPYTARWAQPWLGIVPWTLHFLCQCLKDQRTRVMNFLGCKERRGTDKFTHPLQCPALASVWTPTPKLHLLSTRGDLHKGCTMCCHHRSHAFAQEPWHSGRHWSLSLQASSC